MQRSLSRIRGYGPARPTVFASPTIWWRCRALLPYDLKIGSGASNYDVTPDGQGFVMIRTPDTQESAGITQIILVQNWFEELKRLVPTDD